MLKTPLALYEHPVQQGAVAAMMRPYCNFVPIRVTRNPRIPRVWKFRLADPESGHVGPERAENGLDL